MQIRRTNPFMVWAYGFQDEADNTGIEAAKQGLDAWAGRLKPGIGAGPHDHSGWVALRGVTLGFARGDRQRSRPGDTVPAIKQGGALLLFQASQSRYHFRFVGVSDFMGLGLSSC